MAKYTILVCALQLILLFATSILTTSGTRVSNVGPCRVVKHGTCPDNDHVRFHLFSSSDLTNQGQLIDLDDETTLSTFNPLNPTKIIVHSTSKKKDHFGLVKIREAYLSKGGYNVIVVDYDALVSRPTLLCYVTNRANAPHAAHCIAQLIDRLRSITSDIHVIGFGFGAHIASLVAASLRPYVLPRITGLDPTSNLIRDVAKKLDESDAIFVDVIHTNTLLKGTIKRTGHVDFYVNGGAVQPGCAVFLGLGGSECSHDRATLYFAESISSPQEFWGRICSGYVTSLLGHCSRSATQISMGEHTSINARGFVYVDTSSKAPFALGRRNSFHGNITSDSTLIAEEIRDTPLIAEDTRDTPLIAEDTRDTPLVQEEIIDTHTGPEGILDIDVRADAHGK